MTIVPAPGCKVRYIKETDDSWSLWDRNKGSFARDGKYVTLTTGDVGTIVADYKDKHGWLVKFNVGEVLVHRDYLELISVPVGLVLKPRRKLHLTD